MLLEEFARTSTMPLPILALRLTGAALLCAVIGFEREASDHTAGLRTHMLVGVASAAFALITLHLIDDYGDPSDAIRLDPIRLVEAVTQGVAFLVAGMIFMSQGKVHNLTTGAGLWLAGGIGLAVGLGFWAIAALTAVLGLVIVGLLRQFYHE
jgi:putative Mg2+ transporter-C (MgtC) family protein